MRIFITGGTGFIGFHLVKILLEQNHELMILTRKDLSFLKQLWGSEAVERIHYVQSDINTVEKYRSEVINFNPELVYHLAWEGIPEYGPKMSKLNLENGLKIFSLAVETEARAVISTGSCFEYGTSNGILQGELDEESPAMPRDSLSAARTALRIIGQDLAKEKGCDFIWPRLFYVYGPRQREKSLIPSIISSVIAGKQPEVKTPFYKQDFVYVSDVADALYSFVEYYSENSAVHINGIYNIGSGKSTQVQEIVQKVGLFFGQDYPLRTDLPEKVVDFWSNCDKLEKLTGWKPKTSLDNGIKEMCQTAREMRS
ncbi:MAG: NAD(P)-dependent oxidoreductase [Nanoarchaeota archaeon]